MALAMLFKVGMRVLRDYDDQRRAGIKQPVFDSSKFRPGSGPEGLAASPPAKTEETQRYISTRRPDRTAAFLLMGTPE
jgi:hypothetical protein